MRHLYSLLKFHSVPTALVASEQTGLTHVFTKQFVGQHVSTDHLFHLQIALLLFQPQEADVGLVACGGVWPHLQGCRVRWGRNGWARLERCLRGGPEKFGHLALPVGSAQVDDSGDGRVAGTAFFNLSNGNTTTINTTWSCQLP